MGFTSTGCLFLLAIIDFLRRARVFSLSLFGFCDRINREIKKGGEELNKRVNRIISLISMILMCTIICIGYAAISSSLQISGSVSADGKPFEGVYIKSVEIYKNSNVSVAECKYVLPTNHVTTVTPKGAGASITYKITVHNNTDITYWYTGEDFDETAGKNKLLLEKNGITIT